ncbi:MAG: toll/interleukin-1 receptor domain-containing protein [Chloroflexota bacterium]
MSHIFISHSSADNTFTRHLDQSLRDAGIITWVDFTGIEPEERWVQTIQHQIDTAQGVLLVLSKAAVDSEWVEREVLYAMDQRKPIYVAQIEDMPLPLYLINRQAVDCHTDQDKGIKRLTRRLRAAPPQRLPRALPPEPTEANFFKFMEQLPDGKANAAIARDLFDWCRREADTFDFGGKHTPGFHARVLLGEDEIKVFSVWAYRQRPAVQLHFRDLMQHPPYDDNGMRRSTLISFNRLAPNMPFIPDQADRQPTLALIPALDDPARLTQFKHMLLEIFNNLRGN